MWNELAEIWPYVALLLNVVVAAVASSHAVLNKRDARAALSWIGLIWLAPVVGSLLYVWLGINRIQRKARLLRSDRRRMESISESCECSPDTLTQVLAPDGQHFRSLIGMTGTLTPRPLLTGNHVELLVNGDQAYPVMLQAIREATKSITFCSYIFDNDRAGQQFLDALRQAVERGVAVRVLIDDVGARYSWPAMPKLLSRAGIRCETFLSTLVPWRFRFSNLRTHRKLLVVDGRVGFTGGINIREGNCLAWNPRYPVQDLHFRVTGPVVSQLQEVFAEDWAFSADEVLEGEPWFVPATELEAQGSMLVRGLADGPDEDFENIRLTLLGAIATAQHSIRLVTPYFLPDQALITALNVAAMRGVSVDIVLPEKSNLPMVQWASTAQLWQVLERGCRIWVSPPPFDHSKLLLVDDFAAIVGSANWDPRSLRLNFEFNLECYDRDLAASLRDFFETKLQVSRPVTFDSLQLRSLPVRLRDSLAWLASPFL